MGGRIQPQTDDVYIPFPFPNFGSQNISDRMRFETQADDGNSTYNDE
jgi:hypothetical protein